MTELMYVILFETCILLYVSVWRGGGGGYEHELKGNDIFLLIREKL